MQITQVSMVPMAIAPVQSISVSNFCSPFLSSCNFPLPTQKYENNVLNLDQATKKTENFVLNLRKISSPQEELHSLVKIINIVTTEIHPEVKNALTKTNGYFSRLFSKETWSEWTDYKSDLGKIVSLFSDYLESATLRAHCLNQKLIQNANHEAKQVLDRLNKNGEQTAPQTLWAPFAQIDKKISSIFSFLQGVSASPFRSSGSTITITGEQVISSSVKVVHDNNDLLELSKVFMEQYKKAEEISPKIDTNRCALKRNFKIIKYYFSNKEQKDVKPFVNAIQAVTEAIQGEQLSHCDTDFMQFASQLKKIGESGFKIEIVQSLELLFQKLYSAKTLSDSFFESINFAVGTIISKYTSLENQTYQKYVSLMKQNIEKFHSQNEVSSSTLDALESIFADPSSLDATTKEKLQNWIQNRYKDNQQIDLVKERLRALMVQLNLIPMYYPLELISEPLKQLIKDSDQHIITPIENFILKREHFLISSVFSITTGMLFFTCFGPTWGLIATGGSICASYLLFSDQTFINQNHLLAGTTSIALGALIALYCTKKKNQQTPSTNELPAPTSATTSVSPSTPSSSSQSNSSATTSVSPSTPSLNDQSAASATTSVPTSTSLNNAQSTSSVANAQVLDNST